MAAMSSPGYIGLINGNDGLAESTADGRGESIGPVREVLPELVHGAWKKLRKAGAALTHESPEEDFHRVRILAKRARYAAETVAPFMKKRPADGLRAFAAQAEKVQNVLGEHQDAASARDTLCALAEQLPNEPRTQFWVGRLVGREEVRGEARRDEFFDVWNRLEGKKQYKWPSS
jgi:CHAD domain-containing protein